MLEQLHDLQTCDKNINVVFSSGRSNLTSSVRKRRLSYLQETRSDQVVKLSNLYVGACPYSGSVLLPMSYLRSE